MSTESIDARELRELVRMYGGVLGAIEYGVRSEGISDPELATAWQSVEDRYQALRPNLTVLGRMLKTAA